MAAPNAQAKFVEGNLFRHVSVMALTSSIGLMAVFVVDLINMIYIAMLGREELAAAIGYAGAILFFTTSFGIGMSIAVGALVARALGARGQHALQGGFGRRLAAGRDAGERDGLGARLLDQRQAAIGPADVGDEDRPGEGRHHAASSGSGRGSCRR